MDSDLRKICREEREDHSRMENSSKNWRRSERNTRTGSKKSTWPFQNWRTTWMKFPRKNRRTPLRKPESSFDDIEAHESVIKIIEQNFSRLARTVWNQII